MRQEVVEEVADELRQPSPEQVAVVVLDRPVEAGLDLTSTNPSAWSVEAFNVRGGQQVGVLKKLLNANKAIRSADLGDLVTDDFRCERLVISEPDVVFEGQVFRVERPIDGPPAVSEYRGPDGFARALNELRHVLGDGEQRRTTAKISAVNESGAERSTVQSTVQFEYVGGGEDIAQLTSVWDCTWADTDPTELPRLASVRIQNVEQARAASVLFKDCTDKVCGPSEAFQQQLAHGVDYWMERLEQRFGIDPSGWQGLAIGDADGDGLDDIYVCQSGGLPNRLLVQQVDGTVKDASEAAGVDWWDHTHAALFLDLDGDHDQDLVVATSLGLIIQSNDGNGKFSVKAAKLCPEAMPFTIAAADYDSDGDLDIYACCYSPRGNAIATEFLARPVPYHDANNGGRNCLFRNDGNWQFRNVTRAVGLDENNRRFSLAAAWEDYDNDGDQDLYVANDYGRNNLYRNDEGRFVDVAQSAGVEDISAGMSVSWADYNQDGRMDLYVSNMWSSAGQRIAYQRQFQPNASAAQRADMQRHARGNSLFLNLGDGVFRDQSVAAQVTMGRWAWCSQFVDLNNDSLQDLVVANGFVTQKDDRDL